jgi:molybdopterin molybdotransferase
MRGERDITFARARALVAEHVRGSRPEVVPLAAVVGRRLAADVAALADHPPFTNAAMDGWAIVAATVPGRLRVVGESAAGAGFAGSLGPGETVAISTGAPLPVGADAVVPRERAVVHDQTVEIGAAVATGAFIRHRGDTVRAGDVVLPAGLRVGPLQVAVAAGAGHGALVCAARPRVAVVITGRELVPPGTALGPGEVWNIAEFALPALVLQAGGELSGCVTVGDDRRSTVDALSAALADADLVITTGGVSVGDHDHVRPALAELGVDEVFWGVRMRPGHPTWFGRRGPVRVLALPGNPVASVVCFWVFGRPLMGCDDRWTTHRMGADYPIATPRADLIRCVEGPDGLVPADLQASHHVSGLAAASHLAVVEEGRRDLRKGDDVNAVSLAG